MARPDRFDQQGLTMIELIVSIVIIGISVSGILLVMQQTTRSSADPVIQRQAVAIAESYMEEILLHPFLDPDTGTVCPSKEASRPLYDNVCDYHNLSDSGATDQSGSAIAGLGAYDVSVQVDTSATLASLSGSTQILRVDVTVQPPFGNAIVLSSYRGNF